MEYNSDDKASEKDTRMSNTFESYADGREKDDDKEDSKEKKSKKEKGENRDDRGGHSPEKAEKKRGIFEADEADAKEREKKSPLDELFEQKDIEDDELEAEPALPEILEELSEDEAKLIAKQLVEARDADLQAELAEVEPDSPEEAEVLASALYINKLAEKLERSGTIGEIELDQAADEMAAELDVVAEAETILEQAAEQDVVARAKAILQEAAESGEEESEEAPEEEGPLVTTAGNGSSQAPVRSVPGSSATAGRSGGSPLSPSASTGAAGHGGLPPHFMSGMLQPTASPNMAPANPNILQQPSATKVEVISRRRGGDLLVGGIVGYLIGRRRGRIKTEERLMPVQKSLEKKVRDLDEEITIRERKIRQLTSEKVAREGEDAKQKVTEKVEAKARERAEARSAIENRRLVEKAEQTAIDQTEAFEVVPESLVLGAAEQPRRPERMAGVILSKSELEPPRAERSTAVVKEVVRKMPEAELLNVAVMVEVGGQSAKELYQQGRISKEELREVVVEHLSGTGKAEKILVEKLRPVRSETMEHVPREGAVAGQQSNGQGAGAGADPAFGTQTQSPSSTPPQTDVSAISDRLIAEHAAQERPSASHAGAWIALTVVAAGLAAVFLLL